MAAPGFWRLLCLQTLDGLNGHNDLDGLNGHNDLDVCDLTWFRLQNPVFELFLRTRGKSWYSRWTQN